MPLYDLGGHRRKLPPGFAKIAKGQEFGSYSSVSGLRICAGASIHISCDGRVTLMLQAELFEGMPGLVNSTRNKTLPKC